MTLRMHNLSREKIKKPSWKSHLILFCAESWKPWGTFIIQIPYIFLQPFEQEAKDARDKYQVELQKWEEKMISEGNFDMLRLRSLPKNIDKKTRKPKKMPKMKRVKKQAKPKKATKAKKKKAATKPKSKSKTSSSKKKKTEEEDHTWMRDE